MSVAICQERAKESQVLKSEREADEVGAYGTIDDSYVEGERKEVGCSAVQNKRKGRNGELEELEAHKKHNPHPLPSVFVLSRAESASEGEVSVRTKRACQMQGSLPQ